MNDTDDEMTPRHVRFDAMDRNGNKAEMMALEAIRMETEFHVDECVEVDTERRATSSKEQQHQQQDIPLTSEESDPCADTDDNRIGHDETRGSNLPDDDALFPPLDSTTDTLLGESSSIGHMEPFMDAIGLSPIRRFSIEDEDMTSSLRRTSVTIPTKLSVEEDVLHYFHREEKSLPEIPSADEDFLPTYQPRFSLLFTTIDEGGEESTGNSEDSWTEEKFGSLQHATGPLLLPVESKLATHQESNSVEGIANDHGEEEFGDVAEGGFCRVDSVDTPSASLLHADIAKQDRESSPSKTSTSSSFPTSEELGASSMAFIQHLRGAAFRRKMNLSRSRDSLAAKERKHMEEVAASEREASDQSELNDWIEASGTQQRKSLSPNHIKYNAFKARPVPSTIGILGNGGMVGVPIVEKRPTTTAISPRLGPRRCLENATENSTGETTQPPFSPLQTERFTALPLPKLSSAYGGSLGVPKVEKRPNTTPVSPCLGPRRAFLDNSDQAGQSSQCPGNANEIHGGLVGVPKVRKRPTTVPLSPCLGSRRQLNEAERDSENNPPMSRETRFPSIAHGGWLGVPKVEKRPNTTPVSPCLGPRRALLNNSEQAGQASRCPGNSNDIHGGLAGVPKVRKRPTTVPLSPFLGSRRQLNEAEQDSENNPPMSGDVRFQPALVFKALPFPKHIRKAVIVGRVGLPHAGLTRRHATIPQSPLLGPRRPKMEQPIQPEHTRRLSLPSISRLRPPPTKVYNSNPQRCKENDSVARNMGCHYEFIPRSTERASKRAEFETQRRELEQQRKEETKKDREQHIVALRIVLGKLRMTI